MSWPDCLSDDIVDQIIINIAEETYSNESD
jgi:hypothetical protein